MFIRKRGVDKGGRRWKQKELSLKLSRRLTRRNGQSCRYIRPFTFAPDMYVYCSHQRRLLDVINGLPARPLYISDEFLPVSEAEICSPDGKETSIKSIHHVINKANILFLKEIGDGHRGLGGQVGHKPYPYVPKLFTKSVKLYMPLYTLTGQMQCGETRRVVDVLNSEPRFLVLTNVEISPLAGKSESGISFIAVNKEQILSLSELEDNKSWSS